MRSERLLLWLCTFGMLWIVISAIDQLGARGDWLWGWWDATTFATEQPYVLRFDPPQPDGAAANAGVRGGDRVDLRDQPADARWWLAFQPIAGHPIALRMQRDGSRFTTVVTPSTTWEGDSRLKLLTVLSTILGAVWFVGCATVIALRRSNLREARILAVILLSMGLSSIQFNVPNAQLSGAIYLFSSVICIDVALILLLVLASSFGRQSTLRGIFEKAIYVLVGFQLAGLAAFAYGLQTLRIDPLTFGQNNFLGVAWTSVMTSAPSAAVAAMMIWTVATAPKAERSRAAWLLLPIPIASLGVLIFNSAALDLTHTWVSTQLSILVATIANIGGAFAVTYALLRRRVLDLGFILSRTLVVATISLIVVAAFVLLEWMLGNVVAGASRAAGLAANAGLALILGLSLHYIHKRVDEFVDSVFFRKRHEDERALRDYAKESAFVTEVPVLLDQTIGKLRLHTDARGAAILLDGGNVFTAARSFGERTAVPVSENDEAILALKTWHKPVDPHHYRTELQGALALPMLSRGRLLGMMLLDERSGGESYAPDEVEALSALAHGVGSALDALSENDAPANALLALTDAINALRNDIARLGTSP